jgi:hypothetical protein
MHSVVNGRLIEEVRSMRDDIARRVERPVAELDAATPA